jgi:diadenylate cyclase
LTELLLAFSRLDALAIADILLVAIVFYLVFFFVQGTQAAQLLRGVILLVLAAVIISNIFQLTAFSWLIRNAIPALLIAIPVIFQPELRRALDRLGRAGGLFGRASLIAETARVIDQVCRAAQLLSERGNGGLIVLERHTGLQDIADTGIAINAPVTVELLLSIFTPTAPLHDGAAIIRGGRVLAARCVLPLPEPRSAERSPLGTRHQAAVGITQHTDALSVIISEETGIISLAHGGQLQRPLDEAKLTELLGDLYRPPAGREFVLSLGWWQNRVRRKE